VYAAGRAPAALEATVALDPARVVPVTLDVTDPEQALAAAQKASDASLVINNAGLLSSFGVLASPVADIRRDMDTNFFGQLHVARAFAPVLEKNKGALVNVLTVASLASLPILGGYSASKAATWSLTQSLRADLGPRGVSVYGVIAGTIDTDMARAFDVFKNAPADVAAAILDGVEGDNLDITTDPMARDLYALWTGDPRAMAQALAQPL
jgi:NAD(P)-dependent dehydrogenase (short-subunit alcohol dehydrogenase family)